MFQSGPYFMTEKDQNAALGKMVTRFSEAKTRRAALLSEVDEVGKAIREAGKTLSGLHSVKAFFDGDMRRGDYTSAPDIKPLAAYPDAERVNALLDELRSVSDEIRKLRINLKDAGLNLE